LLFPLENSVESGVLLFCNEELVDPANSLFVPRLPRCFHVFCVERVNDLPENARTGKEETGKIFWIEQDAYFLRQLSALPEQKVAICSVIGPLGKVVQRHAA